MVEKTEEPVVEPEVKEEQIDEVKPVTVDDIDSLTPEEVAKVATGEVPVKESTEPEGEPGEKPEEKPEEDAEKKIKAARKSYYKEVSRRKEIELQSKKALKEKELEILRLKAETNQPLTEDEELELIEDDPAAYKEYIKNQTSLNYDTQIKAAEDEIKGIDVETFNQSLQSNVIEFAAKISNVDIDDVMDEDGALNPNVMKFMQSKQYEEVANYIDERFTKNGLIATPEDMEAAYLLKFKDIVFAQAEASAAQSIKQKIKTASVQTSPLNSVAGGKNLDPNDKFENAKPEDLDSWTPEEVMQYEKWLKERVGI